MREFKFNEKRIQKLINRVFPESVIENWEEFKNAIANQAFRIKINNPHKTLVVKFSKTKDQDQTHKNNQILNYLNEKEIPAPKVFLEKIFDRKYITIMSYCAGKPGNEVYENSNEKIKRNACFNAGKNLREIHSLKIPKFWINYKHEIKNKQEWKSWSFERIKRYLNFLENKIQNIGFLKKELNEFSKVLKEENIDFCPLHWDYHFDNLNLDSEGKITGNFDFDNSMKGHSLADIGQAIYWLRFRLNAKEHFTDFLSGYKKGFTDEELKMIKGYCILHILSVSKSIWFKRKRLGWIIEHHEKMIKELKEERLLKTKL